MSYKLPKIPQQKPLLFLASLQTLNFCFELVVDFAI